MGIREKLLVSLSRFKENTGIFVDGEAYSYGVFFRSVFRSSNAMLANGFAGNCPVAIMGMRGYHTYVGVIGALMAGGYYVPTNPAFPYDRNVKILNASAAKFAILDIKYLKIYDEVLQRCGGLTIIVEKEADSELLNVKYPKHTFFASENYCCDVPKMGDANDEDNVYLLFTSGSTGEPKGVAINSVNVENYLYASSLRFDIGQGDRFIQLFDLTFDLSAHSLFLSITNGAGLYIADDKSLLNPIKFAAEHKITHWGSVPTVLSILEKLRLLKDNILPHIRYTMFCGEALQYALASRFSEAAPNSVIENIYGPTEATIACTYYQFDNILSKEFSINGLVPIGRSFDGMKTTVVDENLNPVEKGEQGELLLSGAQLARGYFNDEAKTKEKFIDIGGQVYYKTGDLVRENEAGLVFVGRIDSQIKIRGYRIELSEIEHETSKYAGTNAIVALPFPPYAINYDGIAIFVENNGAWNSNGLMEELQKKLPAYMLPSKIVPIDEFPRNSSGKTDRNKLKELL